VLSAVLLSICLKKKITTEDNDNPLKTQIKKLQLLHQNNITAKVKTLSSVV